MDELTENDIQLSIDSDDDTRFTFTIVSTDGKKITQDELIWHIELYLKQVRQAERERQAMGAVIQ